MIAGLVQILFFQGLGELASKFLLPSLPGPVIGLMLLLGWLLIGRRPVNAALALVADSFARYLGVLFVPQLRTHAVALACALVASVILTIGCSALVLKVMTRDDGDE